MLRSALAAVVVYLAVPLYAVDCRTRKLSSAETLDEITNQHRTFAQMHEVSTIQIALRRNIAAITRVRGYRNIVPMAQSVELSRAALAYAENICIPITAVEHKTLATMFVGIVAATENTDGPAITRFVNRLESGKKPTENEKAAKKAATIAARQAAGAAVGNAVGELTGQKVGEIVGKVVRGGPIGTAVGILLGASEIGPGDVRPAPTATPSPTPDRSSSGTDHERPGSIHDGNVNDAPRETIDRASRTAYVAIEPTAREKNNQRIKDARAAIKNAKH